MERTILFRGKRLDNGEWVYGGYFKHDTVKTCFSTDDPKTKHYIVCDGYCDWAFEPPLEWFEVDPKTVGQWTGMFDKNGRHIFDGDIVFYQSYEDAGDYATIEYSQNDAMFIIDIFGTKREFTFYDIDSDALEVRVPAIDIAMHEDDWGL